MNRSLKILIFLLVLILIGILALAALSPKEINWTPTFKTSDKNPFGLYVLDKEINSLFKNNKIEKLNETPYQYLEGNYNYENNSYDVTTDFLYINHDFEIDNASVQELLYFASHGNTIFMSVSNFSKRLKDSLFIETDYYQQPINQDSLRVNFINDKSVSLLKGINNTYFTKFDTLTTTVLGSETLKNKTYPNFIKIKHKDGTIYLHSQPIVFTNYYLLQKNKYFYAEQLLNNLKAKNIKWYIKTNNKQTDGSILGYILSQPALKWAWYLSLALVLFFIIFNAKRRQRIIPIQEGLKNTTVAFTKTIGNLYFIEKNHLDIIKKKIIYFLEKIRTNYNIDTHKLDENFVNRLQTKTNRDKKDILEVVACIKRLEKQTYATAEDLLQLNQAIEKLNI